MASCLIALGSNQGNRADTIDSALDRVVGAGFSLIARSTNYSTSPIGGPSGQSEFLNAAALLETPHAPQQVLQQLMSVEQQLGRVRHERWGARTIDLDLLLYDQEVIVEPELIVPHPRLAFRRFVLQPAAQIAPSWQHPQIGWSLERLLNHIDTAANYAAICNAVEESAENVCRQLAKRGDVHCLQLNSSSQVAPEERFQRAASLLETISLPSPSDRWLVSDFWIPWIRDARLLVTASAPKDGKTAVAIPNYDLLRSKPKLLIAICDDAESSNQNREMEDVIATFYDGPVLRIAAPDSTAISQIMAALQGMTASCSNNK